MSGKRLVKGRDRKLFGVCSGFADYFGIDVTVARLIWVLLTFTTIPVFAYIICALVMPDY